MTLLIYGLLGLLMTVLQSTLTLQMGGAGGPLFDLNIPVIVSLGLRGTFKERLPAALLIGFWADCASMAPFGFYMSVYGWFLVAIWVLKLIVEIDRTLVVWVVLMAGVLFESLAGVLLVQQYYQRVQLHDIGWQLVWITIAGGILLLMVSYLENRLRWRLKSSPSVE